MTKLAQAIKQAAQRGEQLYLKRCTVDSVNESERTIDCTPIDDSAQLLSVDLQALQEKNKGLVMFPKVGSDVVVGYLDKNNAVVILTTEIDKITLDITDTITINSGKNGGLCITPELKTQLDKLTARVDTIIDAINNAVPATDQSGAGLQTTMKAILATILKKEDFSNIENEKIKH
ncbi:MAG: hypothetical protein LBN27_10655 [Prevotellaceae bacterium]|jgi:hypothetical protein|nr:hypothetical protein [Prevotellaceae bacterium]